MGVEKSPNILILNDLELLVTLEQEGTERNRIGKELEHDWNRTFLGADPFNISMLH